MYDSCMGSVQELADAIERADIDAGDVAHALWLRDRLDAKITLAVGQLDASGMWAFDGAASPTQWLRANGGLRGAEAGGLVKRANKLRALPVITRAWLNGTLSRGQVEAVLANVNGDTLDALARDEADLVPVLRPLSPEDTALVMRQWREQVSDPSIAEDKPSELHLSELLDGRWAIDGHLCADDAAIVTEAIRLAMTEDAEGETRTAAQRRADAEVDIHRFFLDHRLTAGSSRHRPHVNIVVDIDDLDHGATADGQPLSPAAIRTILCDAGYHRVVTQGRSTILDHGTTTYLVPPALFAALVLRDRHCRHPGCDRPPQWCHAHHVIPFPHGPTALHNLVLKCSRHHRLGHRPGWTDKLEPDGTLHLTAPDGRTWTTTPVGVLPRAHAA